MADPSPSSVRARANRYRNRVEAHIAAGVKVPRAEVLAMRAESAAIGLALDYLGWREPGESFKDYKRRTAEPSNQLELEVSA